MLKLTENKEQSINKNFCLCGCGQVVTNYKYKSRKYIYGHSNWKGGKYINTGGYILIRKSRNKNYSFPTKRKYILEHRHIYEQYYNCCLLSWIVLHHINGNKLDNRIENLQPIINNTLHLVKYHLKKDMSSRYCLLCGSNKTYYNKKQKYYVWHIFKNGFLCSICYSRQRRLNNGRIK